jgi:hypothetical protein
MAKELTFLIHFIVSSSQQTNFEQIDIHISNILERERKAGHWTCFLEPKRLRDSTLHMADRV